MGLNKFFLRKYEKRYIFFSKKFGYKYILFTFVVVKGFQTLAPLKGQRLCNLEALAVPRFQIFARSVVRTFLSGQVVARC